jgi:hypothetical protein
MRRDRNSRESPAEPIFCLGEPDVTVADLLAVLWQRIKSRLPFPAGWRMHDGR